MNHSKELGSTTVQGSLGDPRGLESNVRSYSRTWPVVFDRAAGSHVVATDGTVYVDFFGGAGALAYGHNDPVLKRALLAYLEGDGVVHGLDTMTRAKAEFLAALHRRILQPRGLDYRVQFTGPTGTNAVEAALKLARRVTGRTTVAAFTRGFHGVSLGALAVTGNGEKRSAAGTGLHDVLRLPFDGFGAHGTCGIALLDDLLDDPSSGVECPAAVIVETVQGEGGVNVASSAWLQRLAATCRARGILLIVDDIQAGCGRTGPFFSFEPAGIVPDIVCLSKALSGYGLPFAITLFRRSLDAWKPGEHNGTFRGNNAAFVTGAAALDAYWADDGLRSAIDRKAQIVSDHLRHLCQRFDHLGAVLRGRGMVWAVEFEEPSVARRVAHEAFLGGLLVETSGPRDEAVKLLPALTVPDDVLRDGLGRLERAVRDVAGATAPSHTQV